MTDEQGHCDLNNVHVCFDNDALSLTTALNLHQKLRDRNIPIVVRMGQETGLTGLLQGIEGCAGGFSNLQAFGLLDRSCRPEIVLGGSHELLARAIHEQYVSDCLKVGPTLETNSSLVPWEVLPEYKKESNRRQADQIGAKLKAVNCGITPLTDWDAGDFQFSTEEVELLARLEHTCWMEEKKSTDWRYGPGEKDPKWKTHPCLRPWDELPLVFSGRCSKTAIGGYGNGLDFMRVPLQIMKFTTRYQIPDPQDLFLSARYGQAPIGRNSDGVD